VFAAMLRRGVQVVRGKHPPVDRRRIDELAHNRHSAV
jgi:hypothetical protein